MRTWKPQAVRKTTRALRSVVNALYDEQSRSPQNLKSTAAKKPCLLKFRLRDCSGESYLAFERVPATTRSQAAASESTVGISAARPTLNLAGSAQVISAAVKPHTRRNPTPNAWMITVIPKVCRWDLPGRGFFEESPR